MAITDGKQLKAGRIILGMTINEMADTTGMHRNSVLNAEKRDRIPSHSWAADRIQEALEERGVIFGNESGMASISFQTHATRNPIKYRKRF
tara:strand:- start:60 stop:332 length:273 start_codon:yes stop_codon:yes gene_type:complete